MKISGNDTPNLKLDITNYCEKNLFVYCNFSILKFDNGLLYRVGLGVNILYKYKYFVVKSSI